MPQPKETSAPTDTQGKLSQRQERVWFRAWVISLALFFVLSGAGSLAFVWRARAKESHSRSQILSSNLPDPGVTAPEVRSTKNATPVEAGFYLERVPELNLRESSWTAVFDVWFRWSGDTLKPADDLVVMEGTIESREKLAEYHEGDRHYERHRIVAKITKPFSAAMVPFDSHLLVLAIENGEYAREKLLFIADDQNSSVSSRVSVPGYRISRWDTLEKAHSYKTTRGDPRLPLGTKSTHSQLRMGVLIERSTWGLYVKLFQAMHIAVAIAFLVCFIKPTDVDPRFGLGVGALFATVANSYVVNSAVPDTGEFSVADLINGVGILTILVTLIESTMSLHLFDRCNEEQLSSRLDIISFKILVVGFIAVNVGILVASF